MDSELPPLEPPAGARLAQTPASGHGHFNPLLIFGIAVFGMLSVYLAIVVATQLLPVFFPGQRPLGVLGKVVPGAPADKDAGDINDRINILVMGLDVRRDEPDSTPGRTDSIFVFTMDPYSKTAGIFSIPRDLAVEIPDGSGGYTFDRINTAYERGEAREQGSGPELAIQTVEHNFDIPIDHYVVLNFNNFVKIIDELGGIDVDVPEYIYDPAYNDCNACSYYAVEFDPGPQHMDGDRALAYARLRHSDNDFKRIQRQQIVMRATAKKAAGLDWLVKGKALSIYEEYKDSVKTDVSSDLKMAGLALLGKQIGVDNIRMESLASAVYPCPYSQCGGAAMLLPIPDKIAEIKALVFGDGRLQSENAVIKVVNATPTPHLADDFATYLRSQGIGSDHIIIDDVAQGQLYNNTLILDLTSKENAKEYTTKKLVEWLSLSDTRVKTPDQLTADLIAKLSDPAANLVVVLGADVNMPELPAAPDSARSRFDPSAGSALTEGGGLPQATEPPLPQDTIAPEPQPAATAEPDATPTPEPVATPEPSQTPLESPSARQHGRR